MTTPGETPGGGFAKRSPDLILASASPRRAELLATLGVCFRVAVADLDETPHPGESAAAYVARLARAKARAGATDECNNNNQYPDPCSQTAHLFLRRTV